MPRIVDSLAEISAPYDAVFCDLWGCLHNGVRPFPTAVAALRGFRDGGGKVVLLTNAPRPRASVQRQIEDIGVPGDCWDTIATSGDSARLAMFHGAVGRRVWHFGEPQDASFFEPLHLLHDAVEIERVPLDEAEGIVCTGPFDPHADPEIMREPIPLRQDAGPQAPLREPRHRGRPRRDAGMVRRRARRGSTPRWAARASTSASRTRRSTTSPDAGSPKAGGRRMPTASWRSATASRPTSRARIGEEIDSLFVTGGLAAHETETADQPDPGRLAAYVDEHGWHPPTYAIGTLR